MQMIIMGLSLKEEKALEYSFLNWTRNTEAHLASLLQLPDELLTNSESGDSI